MDRLRAGEPDDLPIFRAARGWRTPAERAHRFDLTAQRCPRELEARAHLRGLCRAPHKPRFWTIASSSTAHPQGASPASDI